MSVWIVWQAAITQPSRVLVKWLLFVLLIRTRCLKTNVTCCFSASSQHSSDAPSLILVLLECLFSSPLLIWSSIVLWLTLNYAIFSILYWTRPHSTIPILLIWMASLLIELLVICTIWIFLSTSSYMFLINLSLGIFYLSSSKRSKSLMFCFISSILLLVGFCFHFILLWIHHFIFYIYFSSIFSVMTIWSYFWQIKIGKMSNKKTII